MRIGWHVPLPGPFYAGGTVWRSKPRQHGYHGTLANPYWKCPHNHSRPDLAQACADREARRRAPALAAQHQAEAEAAAARQARDAAQRQAKAKAAAARQVISTALADMERVFAEHLATATAEDLRNAGASLDSMGTVISQSPALTRWQRRQARKRLGRLRQRRDTALGASEPQAPQAPQAGPPQAPQAAGAGEPQAPAPQPGLIPANRLIQEADAALTTNAPPQAPQRRRKGVRPDAVDLATRTRLDGIATALLSVICPECGTVIGKSCPRRKDDGNLVLLSYRPPILAHLERIKAAIASGAATANAVLAAFPEPAGPSAN
jgi:hypothetical protein